MRLLVHHHSDGVHSAILNVTTAPNSKDNNMLGPNACIGPLVPTKLNMNGIVGRTLNLPHN
jgi:hypothetical protein